MLQLSCDPAWSQAQGLSVPSSMRRSPTALSRLEKRRRTGLSYPVKLTLGRGPTAYCVSRGARYTASMRPRTSPATRVTALRSEHQPAASRASINRSAVRASSASSQGRLRYPEPMPLRPAPRAPTVAGGNWKGGGGPCCLPSRALAGLIQHAERRKPADCPSAISRLAALMTANVSSGRPVSETHIRQAADGTAERLPHLQTTTNTTTILQPRARPPQSSITFAFLTAFARPGPCPAYVPHS